MFTMLNETTVQIERMDGSVFTLSADTQEALMDLVAMWQQPIETWNGRFHTQQELNSSTENTVSVSMDTLKQGAA
jgi:hypothetical protein